MEQRDLNDMAIFAAIAQTNSITGAAEKIKLPKSNVSRRLARLEKRLGVQLLERNTRNSRLTSIGVCYADYCQLMIEEADAADAVIEKSQSEPSGELRISASVLTGQQIIAPAIAAYTQKFPKVQVILELTNSRVNLIEDGFDLAFRIGENQDSSLISQAIATFSLSLYASPEYLSVSDALEKPEDLRSHRCLAMNNEIETSLWRLKRGKEAVKTEAKFTVAANDFLTLRNLASANGGIAMLPTYAVHAECASGVLVPVLPEWHASNVPFSAVYPSRRGATLKQRAFIESVRDIVEYLTTT